MDFFDAKYNKESARNDILFGIIDREAEPYARTTADHADDPWDAVVNNPSNQKLNFIPIDKNIVERENGNKKKSCDGMLYKIDKSFLAFIEIKDRRKSDFAHACEQLASTIELFAENHEIKSFKKRLAFVADHRRPKFQYTHSSEMNEFHSKNHFRLLYQNTIEVK